MKNIAMVVQKRLGDSLFHTPALAWIRKTFPDARLDVFVPSALAGEVISGFPGVDHCYGPEPDSMPGDGVRYDILLAMHVDEFLQQTETALGLEAAAKPQQFSSLHCAERVLEYAQLALTGRTEPADIVYTIKINPADRDYAQALLTAGGQSGDKRIYVGCHVGCHGLAKRSFFSLRKRGHEKVWEEAAYVQFIATMQRLNPDVRVVLTGSRNEKRLTRKLRDMPTVIDLVGETDVKQLAALVDACDVFVTPDTGSLHLACATSTHVVALFGATDPRRFGPPAGHIESRVFEAQSMSDISPQEVAGYVAQVLARRDAAARSAVPGEQG